MIKKSERCKRCKGTGETGGAYAGIQDCVQCGGTGEKDWMKYWEGVPRRY
jgi:DnaJ-class molecular chaperone